MAQENCDRPLAKRSEGSPCKLMDDEWLVSVASTACLSTRRRSKRNSETRMYLILPRFVVSSGEGGV